MFQRRLFNYLKVWQTRQDRLPLLVRGARQVGKTYLIELFGNDCFPAMVKVNFELQPEIKQCFDSLQPEIIVRQLEGLLGVRINPKTTLLFLDEIQECPSAIMALRYFKELMPELAVIGAGSLLEFALRSENFSMPVGRVEFAYLKPLSFCEYLHAMGHEVLLDMLSETTLQKPLTSVIHKKLLTLVFDYLMIGGMPAVINSYLTTNSIESYQHMQTVLLSTYQNDFAKYATHANHKYLQKVFMQTPGLVGDHIKYTKFDQEMKSRDLKQAVENLHYAGVINPVIATTASGLPLNITSNDKLFKLLFLDVGLVSRATKVNRHDVIVHDSESGTALMLNRGALAEQFVGQELLAYRLPYEGNDMFYWYRDKKGSQAEVDYVVELNGRIVPIEVKAGATGHLKSLQLFLEERSAPIGIKISQQPLSFHKKIMSVPLYLISELSRLIKEVS